MGRVRSNASVRIHRKSATSFSGEETTTIAAGRVRARVKFTQETIVSADGLVTTTDGTLVFDPTSGVQKGDLIEILDGPKASTSNRYRVETIDEDLTVTGRIVALRAAVTLDKGREAS